MKDVLKQQSLIEHIIVLISIASYGLKKTHGFKVKHPWEFKKGEKRIGEHKQVRNALDKYGEKDIENQLKKLAKLRKKADYYPYRKITPKDVNNAIRHMKKIFSHLKIK